MAYFAKIENNVVTNVIVAEDIYFPLDYIGGMWVETCRDREDKNYAGIGLYYDIDMDDFIDYQPFDSWNLIGNKWVAPVPYPQDGLPHYWDEKNLIWVDNLI